MYAAEKRIHVTVRVLSRRALNRATLERQLLLARSPMGIRAALEHLIGLQAQEPDSWYTGLWSRLEDFDPTELSGMLESREAVRIALMRSTIHLVTTEDALRLRPLLQPAVARPMQAGAWRRQLETLHAEEITAAGRSALEAEPLTNTELGARLRERWPDATASDLGMAVRVWVPLVQVPPRGLWGRSGPARHAPLEAWVGRPLKAALPVDELVLRYLAAFGPATPADMSRWSGLTRLREVFERLRPNLVTLQDEAGRELYDLPDAPRPDEATPAPVRLLYDFDTLLLAHDDRTRFISHELRRRLLVEDALYFNGTVLVDGYVAGLWRFDGKRAERQLLIRPLTPLSAADKTAVFEEAERLASLWTFEGHTPRVDMAAVDGP